MAFYYKIFFSYKHWKTFENMILIAPESTLSSFIYNFPVVGDKSVFYCLFPVFYHYQFSSSAQSCLTLCDPMVCNMPGFPVHQLPELAQTHVH